MKKISSMRVAAIVLALVLVTSCFVGGTFAKYITSNAGVDSARVAKWGVDITVASSVFAASYDGAGDVSVQAANGTDKVIAPGTVGTAATFTISGDPEVAVHVDATLDAAGALSMVTLPEGDDYVDYTVKTGNSYAGTFDVDEDYHPVKWTLKKGDAVVDGCNGVSLDAINTKVEALTGDYAPNQLDAIVGTYTLTWAWEFGDSANNQKDTYLGNVIAGAPAGIVTTNVVTTEAFSLNISIAQLDEYTPAP